MSKSNSTENANIFNFSLTGEIKRGILWSERTIWIKDNHLLYSKKFKKSSKVLYTIDKYDITQNMNLEDDIYTFKIYEKISKVKGVE